MDESIGRIVEDGNLHSLSIPQISWEDDPRIALRALFKWVEGAAIETISWYISEKTSKAKWSRSLRFLAVILAVLGTVMPVVSVGLGWTLTAIWGYALLGLGAGCVALDKAFGFSSAWTRYLSVATALSRQLMNFQVSWVRVEREFSIKGQSDEIFEQAFSEILRFVDIFNLMIEQETLSWVSEFQANLVKLESNLIPSPAGGTSRAHS
ncbi:MULTISPECIES: DUF4231 domain-containing protein [unclassified Kitasatospora]|uniref:DUF4231 domain-containing protein n=1 Tax=unclassified Kitasatospora TaxID=2633591 RepID=UPI0036D879EB